MYYVIMVITYITGMFMCMGILFDLQILAFWNEVSLVLQLFISRDSSAPGPSFRILGWTFYHAGVLDDLILLLFPVWFQCNVSCKVQYSPHHNMDIGTMWHLTLVSSTPSQSIGLVFGCALFWYWVSLGAPVTISLIEFYSIVIFIMIVVTVIGIVIAINYFLNYT